MDYAKWVNELPPHERKYAPKELYYQGDFDLLTRGRRVAIVGSRNASPEGLKRAAIIAEELVRNDIIVVSGLAKGIDAMAHQSAINAGGKTVAVLGTPLDKPYPAENRKLFDLIASEHLAISQFKPGDRVYPSNFPTRNRTMALISDATIIIEAGPTSGTQSQGWEALRLGRRLYILDNVLNDSRIAWAADMLEYGARRLMRNDLQDVLDDLPAFTAVEELVF
jgi:DNA processing protein